MSKSENARLIAECNRAALEAMIFVVQRAIPLLYESARTGHVDEALVGLLNMFPKAAKHAREAHLQGEVVEAAARAQGDMAEHELNGSEAWSAVLTIAIYNFCLQIGNSQAVEVLEKVTDILRRDEGVDDFPDLDVGELLN